MTDIATLLASDTPSTSFYADYPYGSSVGIPIYELENTDLASYACVVITNAADQRYLQRRKEQLQNYIAQGGRIAFSGHVAYPFLDALSAYVPSPEKGLAGLQIHNLNTHPIWHGVDGKDLTYRKGVAGFYGRGYNPPPVGALVTTTLGTQEHLPIDWIYQAAGSGALLVHAGNDLLSFGNAPSTAGMRAAFFAWAAAIPDSGLARAHGAEEACHAR